jgi:hypothetical protein
MKYFTISMLFISISTFALSEEVIDGQELYMDANCQKCHNVGTNYDFKNKKAKNLNDLKKWVGLCDSQLEIGWFPEEQTSVAEYLNKAHYKYQTK